MPTAELRQHLDQRAELLPLTVDQYHQMIEIGILVSGEPYELLDGFLVRKDRAAAGANPMTIGHEHVWVVKKLAELNPKLSVMGCHMQTQQPITMQPWNEPEPDGAIIVGTPDDYRSRLPSAVEVTCIIEVADSSLVRDRVAKQRIYADSSIPQYVIINLIDRQIEVFTEPRPGRGAYAKSEILVYGMTLYLAAAAGNVLSVAATSLLP
jgi:Uma2 family endonuclease